MGGVDCSASASGGRIVGALTPARLAACKARVAEKFAISGRDIEQFSALQHVGARSALFAVRAQHDFPAHARVIPDA
jgi:hypothetical protein